MNLGQIGTNNSLPQPVRLAQAKGTAFPSVQVLEIGETQSKRSVLSLPKMLSGTNALEIGDIERMNIGAHQPAFRT